MKLPITLLVLAAIGHAADSRLIPTGKTKYDFKNTNREVYDGNFGLRNGVSFDTKFGVTPGNEYADFSKAELADKSPDHSFFGERVPQISKISDVLTGQGPPFEVALANHLYSPVPVYQARFSSPTTFDPPQDDAQPNLAEYKLFKQNQHFAREQYEKSQNLQAKDSESGYVYKKPLPEYTRAESKLHHLETALSRLEPSYPTPSPNFPQEVLIQPQFQNDDFQIYPQYSFQQLEHIPLRYPDGSLQPVQYVHQSLIQLVPLQSVVADEEEKEEQSDDSKTESKDQDYQPNEKTKVVEISTPTPNQNYDFQQGVQTNGNLYQNQPYEPSKQYFPPEPHQSNLISVDPAPPTLFQQTSTSQQPPQQEQVQFVEQNQYQYYQPQQQQYIQTETEPVQLDHVQLTTPQPEKTLQPQIQNEQQFQQNLSTEPSPATFSTIQPVTIPQTTFKPISDFSTSPKPLLNSVQTTTIAPYSTHNPLSRIPEAPLRPISRLAPVSRPLPYPRPFSNTQSTTLTPPTHVTTLPPLPAFRRYPHLNTRFTTVTPTTAFSTFSTITSTPRPNPTETFSTPSLPTTTVSVSRKPIIRIRHKPTVNQYQSTTTPLPPQSESTTSEPLIQTSTTFQSLDKLEPESQTQQPEPVPTAGFEYLPPSEMPPKTQSEVLYHLQREPQIALTSPRPDLGPSLSPPVQIISSPQPEFERYSRPTQILDTQPPPLQSYEQPIQYQSEQQPYLEPAEFQSTPQPYSESIQFQSTPQNQLQQYQQVFQFQPSPPPHLQSFLRSGQFQLYQSPVFNLRPQYEPLSTSLPPLESNTPPKTSQLTPLGSDLQEQIRNPVNEVKPVLKTGKTYLPPRPILSSSQPILQPHIYSQSQELLIQPDKLHPAVPTFSTVQYFGKYAEAIFGHYRH